MKLGETLTALGLMLGLLGVVAIVWDSESYLAAFVWTIGLALILSGYAADKSSEKK